MMAQRGLFARFFLKWIWFKHAGSFHFSHHPLCHRFRLNVFHLGQLHICRSCVCLYLGMFSGIFLTWVFADLNTITNILLLVLGFTVVVLSFPPIYAHCSRGLRDVLRYLTGVFVSWSLMQFVLGQYWL